MTWVPDGFLGDAEVVGMAQRLVRQGATDPRTVQFARTLVSRSCASGDVACAIATLERWLRGVWYYLPDPKVSGLRDTLQTVPAMLDAALGEGRVVGDCDEAAVLAASLGAALGFPARLQVVSYYPHIGYHHIYAEVMAAPGQWVKLDPTMPADFRPPLRALTVPV